MAKEHVLNYTIEELVTFLQKNDTQKYRAKQILDWIYKKHCTQFSDMVNIPKDLRQLLDDNFYIASGTCTQAFPSHDETTKMAIKLQDKNIIEAVYIPEGKRITGCISSQAGCPLDCQFCASAYAPYKRNLTAGEIMEQVMLLASKAPEKKLSNLVLMGIGEPLLNPNLYKFLQIVTAPWGVNHSPRKITLATAGMVPKIYKLADTPPNINLAISLHAPNDELRRKIMPKVTYSIKETIEAAKYYVEKTGRIVTFEYILIAQMNDSISHANELAISLKGFPRKINIIPYNPVPYFPHNAPSPKKIKEFVKCLENHKIPVSVRKKKGREVQAACGQLRIHLEEQAPTA